MTNELEQISKEIHAWAQFDQEYTQMLIVYAHSKDLITAEQAEAAIADLHNWWEENDPAHAKIRENRKQAMMKMLDATKDLTTCKVFWTLFTQAPQYSVGEGWFKAPHEKNWKAMSLRSKVYYNRINKLCDLGYLEKIPKDGLLLKVNMQKLDDLVHEEATTD